MTMDHAIGDKVINDICFSQIGWLYLIDQLKNN
ncbi:hypothetical protein SAMN05444682_11058 [Parapedobacter indicus]|uniref:Uncharacterized protein n=1 Tax=Parapedobacter indicus TaxID=1477437 RepID=A0A1I3RQJ8_9SPHI|nr:hypothetical protein CLV26_110188 [Parapedobacter indicus]SFJ47476.1 hypothetical protein SAMN05444682_11058 [Parapedobacter indicus]